MELHAEWRAFVCKTSDDFTSFSIPQVYHLIKTCRQVFPAVICEADISDCLLVTLVRADALPMSCHIPDLAGAVMTCRQQQVTSLREEFDTLHTLVMATPSVQPLLRNKAIMILLSQIAGCLHEALACLVEHTTVTMVNRGWFEKCI